LLIAAALACQPKLVVADEPTTALDVTTQQQILMLMKRLTHELRVSMLFISHDFGVISELCDRVSVMYAGQTAETGDTRQIIDEPLHPYTRMLLACHPDRAADLAGIPGQVPSALDLPGGCHFHPRCPSALAACSRSAPPTTRRPDGMHEVACWLHSGDEAIP
jgi:oligopeptide/dipeptide ABC transporter ATP-binding protein